MITMFIVVTISLFIFVCLDLHCMLLAGQEVLRIGKRGCFCASKLPNDVGDDRQSLCLLCLWGHSWKKYLIQLREEKFLVVTWSFF